MKQLFPRKLYNLIRASVPTLLLITTLAVFANHIFAQEETQPSISQEKITENLKERLMNVVKEKEIEATKRKAWVGNLSSIANQTLTIETRSGPKLASTSAETSFIRSDDRAKLKIEDLVLGTKTIAMGYLDDKQVLNAYRVVLEDEGEVTQTDGVKRSANFVTIESYTSKTDMLELKLQSNGSVEVEITKNTEITSTEARIIVEADEDALKEGVPAVAIIETTTEDEEITRTLLHIHILKDASPLIGIEIGAETTIATESPQKQQEE